MNKPASSSKSAKILTAAINKTEKVQDELKQAADALSSTNTLLSSAPTSAQATVAAVADALEQNIAAEATVHEASQELEAVKDLIETAKTADRANANTGQGTASILAYFEGRRDQAKEDERNADDKSGTSH